MVQSRKSQVLVTLLLGILVVGVTFSAVYFSNQPQIPGHTTDQTTNDTTEQTPMDITISLFGEIDTGGSAFRVHVDDDRAYVIDIGENELLGLVIVNISNPSQPEILGTYHDGGLPFALEAAGDIVYIADQMDGLKIINVSDPFHPTAIDGYIGSGVAFDLEIVGNLLFMTDRDEGLVILNISTPSAPVFVSNYGYGGAHLDIEGDIAYIADHAEIRLVNISDPNHPTYVNWFLESGSTLWDPSVSNGIIYLANHGGDDGELQIIDATDPDNIEKISEFDSVGTFQSFYVQGSFLYAVDYEIGLYLLNVSDSSSPSEIARFSDGGRPWDVVLSGDYVYLCGSEGLQILQVICT